MYSSLKAAAALLLFVPAAGLLGPAPAKAQSVPSIRRVQVLRSGARTEIEIEASEHIVPQVNLLSSPDRLVVDFVNARPSAELRNVLVNRPQVKELRVGLFSSDPPVTRVVLDLNGPQPYQVFPSGKTVILKVGGNSAVEPAAFHPSSGPVLVNATYPARVAVTPIPATSAVSPRLEVSFQNGLLSISSNKANLSEILFAVHQRTGAEIAIPAGAEQEQVAAELGPAPAPEVLAHLLNGSKFNFMILNSSSDPRVLDRVILSPRAEGSMPVSRPQAQPAVDEESEDAQPRIEQPARPVASGPRQSNPAPPATVPEVSPPTGEVPD